jgi:hypothetical protein
MKGGDKRKNKPIKYGRKPSKAEYVEYDESARQEYVLGFHKRKVEKQKQRVEKAKLKKLEEKREHLREKRKELARVIPLVEKIDSVLNDKVNESMQETLGKKTKTTVIISEFDPNE